MNIFYFKKFFLLLILFLGIISLNVFNKDYNQDPLTKQSYSFFSEIQFFFFTIHSNISNYTRKYLFLLNLRKENKLLKNQNQILQIKQQRFEDTLKENKRLRKLIDVSKKKELELLTAQVISYDLLSRKHILIINKGSSHGVKKFMGVSHPKGVVGFVFRVSPHTAQVITLRHPLSSLPVRNRRNRQAGLAVGSLNQLKLKFWNEKLNFNNPSNDFKEEDILITVKSNQFPPGLIVGQAHLAPSSNDKINPEIHIQTSVNFESLEELFIILKPFKPPFPYNKKEKTNGT